MTRDEEQVLEALLRPARAFLEPGTGDVERVFHGVIESLAARAADARIPSSLGKPGPEHRAGWWAARSRVGIEVLASVAVAAASVGFFTGFVLGERRAEPTTVSPRAIEDRTDSLRDHSGDGVAAPIAPDTDRHTLPEPVAEVASPPLEARPARGATVATPAPVPQRSTRSSHAVVAPVGSRAATQTDEALTLAQAIELLQRARSAKAAGHPNAALLLLSELDRRAPADLLAEERLLAQVLVWCDLGNPTEARRLARVLRDRNPSSIYSRRLARSCATTLSNVESDVASGKKH